jgi:ligand-binding SRPBCC domain-containing protein
MSVHTLVRKQLIQADIDSIWQFFSSPDNLAAITPTYMNFRITSEKEYGIYPGQIITYKVSPLLSIPLSWMTEITHVVDKRMFVDEQRVGPYSLWHHKHLFEQTPEGILMTDIVHYQLPLYFIGDIIHYLFIKQQLHNIFDYRHEKVKEIFDHK